MTRRTENNAMVHVMFACFVLMFAITAMDVKKHMHRRAAARARAVAAASAPKAPPPPLPVRSGGAPLREAATTKPPTPAPPSSFWESAAGIRTDGPQTIGAPAVAGIEIKPLCVHEEAPARP